MKYAICNEIFENWTFPDTCKAIRKAGYTGIEIAPFTLSSDPATISASLRREYRNTMDSEGLRFVGLHWLMAVPKGLHVTTLDVNLRAKSWRHITDLVDLCADLGPGGVMVFGSPKQRGTTGGSTPAEATRRFVDGLQSVASHALDRGVTILIEALPRNQCDVILTLREAAEIVEKIWIPSIQTMFDTHNAVDETEAHEVLIDRYFDVIRHVHLNEIDGGHPGTGSYDFQPVLNMLERRNYTGWISVEAFLFGPGGVKIATESLQKVQLQALT